MSRRRWERKEEDVKLCSDIGEQGITSRKRAKSRRGGGKRIGVVEQEVLRVGRTGGGRGCEGML